MVSEEPARSVTRRLRDAGFAPRRTVGSHTMWARGSVSVSVPDGHRTISPGVVRQVDRAIEQAEKEAR